MSQDGSLAANVAAFLVEHIASVAQLEVLLLLRARGHRMTAAAIGQALRIDDGWAETELHALATRGLLVETVGPPVAFELAPGPALGATLDSVATAYTQRRGTVVSLILAKPSDTVRVFADAFCLRKE